MQRWCILHLTLAYGARSSCAVRRANISCRPGIQTPGYLRHGPLVYRVSAERIGFYDYHRSATNPRQLVTVAIADHLRASGNFADVTVYDGRLHADYVIT